MSLSVFGFGVGRTGVLLGRADAATFAQAVKVGAARKEGRLEPAGRRRGGGVCSRGRRGPAPRGPADKHWARCRAAALPQAQAVALIEELFVEPPPRGPASLQPRPTRPSPRVPPSPGPGLGAGQR